MTLKKGTLAERQKQMRETPPWKQQKLARDYAQGMSQVEVAKKHGVNPSTVRTVLRKLGIPSRGLDQRGSRNHQWKGYAAGYTSMHLRVVTAKGKPKACEVCGATDPNRRYHWANVTGDYWDIDAYVRMCVSCHHKQDHKINNIRWMKSRPILGPQASRATARDSTNGVE